MWRVLAGSEIGTAHIQTGRTCEDSCWAQVLQTIECQPFLAVFVADGAGSAARGGEGAELAMSAAAGFIEKKLKHPELGLGDELAVGCVQAVRASIDSAATAAGLKPRDYACTFLGLLSFERGSLLMQVGDGGIVVDFGNGLEVPIEPMGGEYANMTCFVTGEDAIEVLQTKSFSAPVIRAAVFSDGLQRLALNMATNAAHVPFFKPLFTALAKSSEEQEDQLAAALQRFLSSESVNQRTDDDKTLVIAVLPVSANLPELVWNEEVRMPAPVPVEQPPTTGTAESETQPGSAPEPLPMPTPKTAGTPQETAPIEEPDRTTRQRLAAAAYAKNQEG
jgi:hypothetical protein